MYLWSLIIHHNSLLTVLPYDNCIVCKFAIYKSCNLWNLTCDILHLVVEMPRFNFTLCIGNEAIFAE